MALTSLNNISIPADGTNQALLMPKLKYRFRVTLLGFGVAAATELTKQVKDVTRPKVNFEEMTLDVYNSKVYRSRSNSTLWNRLLHVLVLIISSK